MKNSHFKEKIIARLKKKLPGQAAQELMAPEGRKRFKVAKIKQFAAVLLLLYPENNSLYTVLIKRPDYEGVHGGQIAFPGGKLEVTDLNLEQTAIRECREELGFNDEIEILGKLTPLFIPVSGFEVHPYIGFLIQKPSWNPDLQEVARVIEIELDFLSNSDNRVVETWNLHGHSVKVPFYKIDNKLKIWGATAMIISEFLEIVKKI